VSDSGDSEPGAPSARLAFAAIGVVVALVLGTILFDSLKGGSSDSADTGQTDIRPPAGPGPTSGESDREPLPERSYSAAGILDLESWRDLLAKDPRAAAVSVAQMPADDERDARLTELMVNWTERDPDSAGSWLLEQTPGEFRTESSAEFTRAWADRDPTAAAKWIGSRSDHPAAVDAVGGLLARWAHKDADAAREWAESLPPGAAREVAGAALAYTWAQDDARAASTWVANIDDPALRSSAARNLVNAWSHTDPRSAADWLSANLRDPADRDAAALPLIMTWADTDPLSASKWVAGLPGGQLQEQSKAIFAEALAHESPEDAVTWANSIEDQEQRTDSVLNIYESWMENDKPALLAHLRDNLTAAPALRQQIYDMLYEHDPDFRAELIGLYEGQSP